MESASIASGIMSYTGSMPSFDSTKSKKQIFFSALSLTVLALGITTVSAYQAAGQESSPPPDPVPASCSDGTFVANPQNNPDLVSDCKTLLALKNSWLSHPENASSGSNAIFSWGIGIYDPTGTIPNNHDISTWQGLTFRDNKLVGLEISCLTSELSNCQEFYQLQGSIPPEIGNFTNLEDLNLGYNRFNGPLPSEIGKLTSLKKLFIEGIAPGGSIPQEIGNLVNLQNLGLHGEIFAGTIPQAIGSLSSLTELAISGSTITGQITNQIGELSQLKHLSIFDTEISGLIPSQIWNLTKLEELNLSNNQLSGSISSEIGNLAKLANLKLRSNKLSGHIPSEIGNLSKLQLIDLGFNELEGIIPSTIENLLLLETLRLNNNQFSGSIPSEIGKLHNLESLYIQSNSLSGTIPSELENLSLDFFYFCNNNLEGPVPASLRLTRTYQTHDTGPAPIIDRETGEFFCPLTWRAVSVRGASVGRTIPTDTDVLEALGVPAWIWNAQNQYWSRLESADTVLVEGAAIAYRSPTFDEQELIPIGLGTTNRSVDITLYPGWNVLSAPQRLQSSSGGRRAFFIDDTLIDCDGIATGITAVVRYNNTAGSSAEFSCGSERGNRSSVAGYPSIDRIEVGDFLFVYFRSVLPLTVSWNPTTRTYEPTSNSPL